MFIVFEIKNHIFFDDFQHATILSSENIAQALKKSYAKYNGDKIHDTNF